MELELKQLHPSQKIRTDGEIRIVLRLKFQALCFVYDWHVTFAEQLQSQQTSMQQSTRKFLSAARLATELRDAEPPNAPTHNAVPCEDEIEYVNDTFYKSLLKWFVRYRSLARCARVFFSTFSDVYKKFHRIILRLLLR